MIRRTRTPKEPQRSVVDDVARQVEQANALAGIGGQDRLADPLTNPAVRSHADKLRNDQHRRVLDDRHRRVGRAIRVQDQRAASAERALLVIQQAREATSPAQSVLALHVGRQRAMGASLTASIALMIGAATGVAALAESWNQHGAAGYVAEVGMTGLSTAAILVRSHLARHGYQVTGWQSAALWALAIVPMLASIAANAKAAGPIGIACSIGAAAFAALAHLIADSYGEAIQDKANQVTRDHEAELRAVALGEDPAPTVAPAAPVAVPLDDKAEVDERPRIEMTDPRVDRSETLDRWAADQADSAVEDIRRWLDQGPDDGTTATPPAPTGPAPTDSANTPDDGPAHTAAGPAHIGGDQDEHPAAIAAREATKAGAHIGKAHAARRAAGEVTRRRVLDYVAEHPDAGTAEIASELDLSTATVRRYRPGRESGEAVER